MPSSLRSIERLRLQFADHQHDIKLTDALNSNFGNDFDSFDEIFTDAKRTALKDSVVKVLHKLIVDKIKVDLIFTDDPFLTVTPMINNCRLFVENDNGQVLRLSVNSLTRVINSTKHDVVNIICNMDHVSYDYTQGKLDVLNWDNFNMGTAPPTTTAPVPPVNPVDIATAVATAVQAAAPPPGSAPSPIDATALGKALTSAMAPLIPKSSSAPTTATMSNFTAIPTAHLPKDVLRRWENFNQKNLIPGKNATLPYSNSYLYYVENTHIFLSNGQVFHTNRDPDEKLLMKMQCYCTTSTQGGVRSWYKELTSTLFSCGMFCLPIWSFRGDHGGTRGFSIGTATTLCSIIRIVHPFFHQHPARFIKNYPRQNGRAFQDYYNSCTDYQQLRAIVFDECRTFDDANELDLLLENSDYPTYLHQATRNEREQSSFAAQYSRSQVLQTILKKLTASDSPLSGKQNRSLLPTQHPTARVHYIDTHADEFDDYECNDDDIVDPELTDLTLTDIVLDDVDVPEGQESLFATYGASVAAINARPKLAFSAECVVCEGRHSFDKCPTLKNQEFLKSHYIRYCQLLRRDRNALNRPSRDTGNGSAPRGARRYDQVQARHVNYVETLLQKNDYVMREEEEDFLEGRI